MTVLHKKIGKLCKGSIAASFSNSAHESKKGGFCDTACKLWERCYAARSEVCFPAVGKMMTRHFTAGPRAVLAMAVTEFPRVFPWMRWCVYGSLPMRKDFKTAAEWNAWRKEFRAANAKAKAAHADVHLPLESPAKAKAYRSILKGLDIVVRRSSQVKTAKELLKSNDHMSFVVGEIHNRPVSKAEKEANTLLAHDEAAMLRANGKTVVVCPYRKGDNPVLCGDPCRACPNSDVDIVLYAFHG